MSLNFPFRCKLEHLRMLQGMKMIASLVNTRSGRSDMDGFFTYTNHSHQSASKMMNFLVEECHRDSPFIFFEWLWVMIDASWTLSMWLAHCCPIRRGVFLFSGENSTLHNDIPLLPRISINFQKRKVAFCTYWEKTRLLSRLEFQNRVEDILLETFYARLKARLPFKF